MSLISIDNPKEESFHFRNGVVVRMDYGISSAKMMGCLKDMPTFNRCPLNIGDPNY